MRTRWKERTRNDFVATARFFVCGIIVLSIFVQTRQQQRDTKPKWDNRLLPTNSVYEQPQHSVPPASNVPSVRSPNPNRGTDDTRIVDRSSPMDNVGMNDETNYEDDYEIENPEYEIANVSSAISTLPATPDDRRSNEKLPIDQDEDYFYYEDYENEKSPEDRARDDGNHPADDNTSSKQIADPSSTENHSNVPKITSQTTSKPILPTTRSPIDESPIQNDSPSTQHSPSESKSSDEHPDARNGQILIGEAVVSVVTTKSVVNGTISVPVSPSPMTTEQMSSPIIASSTPNPGINSKTKTTDVDSDSANPMETTEDSIIVASVQTSRSISGARFLPFLVAEGVDKNASNDDNNSTVDKNLSPDVKTTVRPMTKLEYEKKMLNDENEKVSITSTTRRTPLPVGSTESIIDKLDRVQSELSSGFLAGGFRNSGNNLQLDVPGEQQTRKTHTTTSRTPIISKFVPRRSNQERKVSSTTPIVIEKKYMEPTTMNDDVGKNSSEISKSRWPSGSRNWRPTSNTSKNNALPKNNVRPFGSNVSGKSRTALPAGVQPVQDITSFLPPGYKLEKKNDEIGDKSLVMDILARAKIGSASSSTNQSPKAKEEKSKNASVVHDKMADAATEQKIPIAIDFESLLSKTKANSSPFSSVKLRTNEKKFDKETSTISSNLAFETTVDISQFLPPGYKLEKAPISGKEKPAETTTESSVASTTVPKTVKPSGNIRIVFPTRLGGNGGRKPLFRTMNPTQGSRPKAGGSGAVTPKIQKGGPVRITTEFTGWPTPSTTPISIEKLLEAARTATVSSVNVSTVPTMTTSSTTSTTTTTTTTQRSTTPGICVDKCEIAGTIRIVGNAKWVPELLDRNTVEYRELEKKILSEIDTVFNNYSVLSQWYNGITIDAFSPGSILVDYFIGFTELKDRIDTQELKMIFHDSLVAYNTDKWNETKTNGSMKLGNFVIDPKSTDFVVNRETIGPQNVEMDNRLIPQWAIAVIVIGVGGLLFTIIFGVSVLVNREKSSKSKPSQPVYTSEVAKNMIQASHGVPSHRSSQDYPKSEISTIWNDTTAWREKSFESNSNEVLVDGTLRRMDRHMDRDDLDDHKYNVYDSWRSEWNGPYYNPSHGSSKFAGYESTTNLSRHIPPDYDPNF